MTIGTPGATPARTSGRSRLTGAAMVAGGFVVLLYLIEAVDVASGLALDRHGIVPRSTDGLQGVAFAPLLHHGWDHLFANTLPLLVLGFVLMLSGVGRGIAVTAVVWIVGGLGTWLTGASASLHVGASIVVFGWLSYLIVRGVFARDAKQLLVGLLVLIVYGSALWGVLPTQEGISWQGHLFGALAGVLAAWMFAGAARRTRAQRTALPPSLR